MKRQAKGIGFIIIIGFLTKSCYTTTSDVKYTKDNEEYRKLKELKYENKIGVKTRSQEADRLVKYSANFYEDSTSDFRIEYKYGKTCEKWFDFTLSVITFSIIPNREKCTDSYSVESFYRNEKRQTLSFSKYQSTYYWIGLFIFLSVDSKPPATFEEQYKIFIDIALKKIYDDFLILDGQRKEELRIEAEKEYYILESMAKAAKINLDQILDLRNETIRDEFLLSWYNSKENPDIENYMSYSENEFKFQEDKKNFQDYRKYKYAITDSYWIWGEYDFNKKALSISQGDTDFVKSLKVNSDFTVVVTRLLELTNSLKNSDTIKSTLSLFISPEKAEKFKSEKYNKRNVIILSKFSPAFHTTTGKCIYPDQHYEIRDNEYKECKKRFDNKQMKFKYLLSEPLKYRIVYDGEVYKNY